ncbi:MAG TPA: dUTP diphosphatase [Chitinophagaceae bacterium]
MAAVEIKVINQSSNPMPGYATEGAAGMDIRAHMEGPMLLKPLQRELVPTGLYFEIPEGYEVQIRPRSGLAINQGITCLNTPGTIDSDYRGEIKIILINLSGDAQSIYPGDRIAQMVVKRVERAHLVSVTQLSETGRSNGGFGSTGKK